MYNLFFSFIWTIKSININENFSKQISLQF